MLVTGKNQQFTAVQRWNVCTGGGGYTKPNVARCWAYETSVLVDSEIDEHIPPNIYYEYYLPDRKINIELNKDLINRNTATVKSCIIC